MRIALACLSLALIAGASAPSAQTNAQRQSQPRAVQFPDTLGAAFSIADSAHATGTPADYDFLAGVWHFRFQQRRADGGWDGSFTGHWSAERVPTEGAMITDHWRADDPSSPYASGTYTYRVYNPQRTIWEMQGVNPRSGGWEPGLTWSDGENRYAIQHYGATIMRIRYLAISANHFLWRADQSTDGGKTWQLDHWTMDATRIGK